MKKNINPKVWLILAFIPLCYNIWGQDVHFSQIASSPLNINPGLTGVHNGDYRFIANYRNQWNNVPVSYLQCSGSVDWRISDKKGLYSPWATGFIFNYDRAGDSKLTLTGLNATGSYTRRLGKSNFLTLGALLGANQRSFSTTNLHFDDQYDGDSNDQPTTEVFPRTSRWYFDFSAGLNWYVRKDTSRTGLNLGLGMYHLNRPEQNFLDENPQRLPMRYSLYGVGVLQLAKPFDLVGYATAQFQGPATETVLALSGRLYLNTVKTKELALEAGLGYRLGDAFIPRLGLSYRSWQVGLSYDINSSPFKTASYKRGGPEVSVIYVFTKVPPMEFCPVCPTYL